MAIVDDPAEGMILDMNAKHRATRENLSPGRLAALLVLVVALVALVILLFQVMSSPDESAPTDQPVETSARTDLGVQQVYVDCQAGDDAAAGDGKRPWKSLTRLNTVTLGNGTTVHLKRGCSWSGTVQLRVDAAQDDPVVVQPYGDGAAPVLTAPEAAKTDAILTVTGAHATVDGLHLTKAPGTGVAARAADTTLRNLEIDDVAIGVRTMAERVTAEGLKIHDLHMLTNTAPGDEGDDGDDDAGAVGFSVEAADTVIRGSSCTNCRAQSYDYGHDGGFVDVWNHGDRLKVINNTATNVEGFLEIGGDVEDASAVDLEVTGNKIIQSYGGIWLHDSGKYAMRIENITVTGNTFENVTADKPVMGGKVSALTFRDNTVTTRGKVSGGGAPATHENNRYRFSGGQRPDVGFDLGNGETADTDQGQTTPPTAGSPS